MPWSSPHRYEVEHLEELLGSTYKFMATNITKSDVDQFFLKCILQVFAKSIHNVPVDKASWHSIWLHSFASDKRWVDSRPFDAPR